MNDFAISTQTISRSGLQGLPQRLVMDGLVADTMMVEAIASAKERRVGIVSYLVEHSMADAREIAIAASHEFGAPLLDLDAIQPDLDTVRIVSEKILRKHRVLPLVKRGKKLFIAISDPTNLHALDEVKFATGFSIEAVVVEEDKLNKLLTLSLEQVDTSMPELAGEDFEMDGLEVTSGDDDASKDPERSDAVDDAPIVRFINKVMLDAIKKGASDIHFEPYERSYRIRFRLDGILKEVATPPVQLAIKMAARLKVMSRMDIAERRVPQDGRIKMKISKNRAIDFRVSTCPTLFGEKIVMRILDPSSAMLGIDALGYEAVPEEAVHGLPGPAARHDPGDRSDRQRQDGVALHGAQHPQHRGHQHLDGRRPRRNHAARHQPGEHQPEGRPDLPGALRAFLRQDPDVIMVGEIRDLETAEIAIKAAQTGHLVLSTLHTNDAPKTLTRLVDMGVKPYAIATSVSLIIAQRLARRLCNSCKAPMKIPAEALKKEGFEDEEIANGLQIFQAVGCSNCTDGYKGRTGLYEVMPVSEEIGRIIMTGGSVLDIKQQATREGVWGLRQAGINKVRLGITTLDEINRVTVD